MSRGSGRGSSGGFRDGVGRAFAEDPLNWALPLYTAFGIRVRVHVVLILFAVAQLIYAALTPDTIGPGFMLLAIASLFLLVLAHEYGHCVACRRVGGEADDILMWPLGGLATCVPPERWGAHLVTTLGGPAVNVALLVPLSGLVLLAGGGWEGVLFNPFFPAETIKGMSAPSDGAFWVLVGVWWLHYMNLVLLAFNVLIPMYPLDGARIVHALLWKRLGLERATLIGVNVGIASAVVLVVFGMVTRETMLMGIGLFGGIVCWVERRRLTAPEELAGPAIDLSAAFDRPEREEPPSKREAREIERRRRAQEEVDRILAKIAGSGMQSLSPRERRTLEQETARRRKG